MNDVIGVNRSSILEKEKRKDRNLPALLMLCKLALDKKWIFFNGLSDELPNQIYEVLSVFFLFVFTDTTDRTEFFNGGGAGNTKQM